MEYHYSVGSWLKAGRPHDEPFLIVRESIRDTANFNESAVLLVVENLCTLIIDSLTLHRDETEGSGYHIEPVPPILHSTWSFNYRGFTFSVYAEPSILGPSRVRISVGAIATILSDKEVVNL